MFLDRIVAQARLDLEQRKLETPLELLRQRAAAQPAPRDLYVALSDSEGASVKLIAEFKRASPSKGLLAPHLDPLEVARIYEANGAAAISVLTEPHFFLGSPDYLTAIKQAVHIPVLRKDFIFDEYQVVEARAWGADAVLLICAILDDEQLRHLLEAARKLHMRCLVEVHTAQEARRAVDSGAEIIGVNSRDLATFAVYPRLLRELRPLIPADRVVVAESGIHSASDARLIARHDAQAMLVGESLVVSDDIAGQMRSLLQGANTSTQVKICGLKMEEHLQTAIDAGADMLGLIFYEPSHRYISPREARSLLQTIEKSRANADVVGVFVNREADFINDISDEVGLDIVQLHGDEAPEFARHIRRPIIKGLHAPVKHEAVSEFARESWRVLLDTPTPQWGGTGETHDWELARSLAQHTRLLLAGGLTPENVASAVQQVRPWGVDVSSGVETNKTKDSDKIHRFLHTVRSIEG